MSVDGLEKLNVWRKAKEFAVLIYHDVIPLLPKTEQWAMSQQIRRSAISIPANIAEGWGRYYFQETIRFCYIARGSLEETISFVILARELNYLPNDRFNKISVAGDELGRLINGYIAYLKKARTGIDEPGNQSIHESPSDYLLDLDPETMPDE
jgi:four helix bundle protein